MKPDRAVFFAVLLSGFACFSLLAAPPALSQKEITEEKYSSETSELPLLDLEPAARTVLATSNPDYPVTPGDAYVLTFQQGLSGVQLTLVVKNDYTVNLSIFGKMNTLETTFAAFQKRVEKQVLSLYPQGYRNCSSAPQGSSPWPSGGRRRQPGI